MSEVVAFEGHRPVRPTTSGRAGRAPLVIFNRHELDAILQMYSRMVRAGEWRDYSIEFEPDRATFSIFRRTSEGALYRIVKTRKASQRQGSFSVISAGGRILRRGYELGPVLSALNAKRLRLV
jgi:hypothetical protein